MKVWHMPMNNVSLSYEGKFGEMRWDGVMLVWANREASPHLWREHMLHIGDRIMLNKLGQSSFLHKTRHGTITRISRLFCYVLWDGRKSEDRVPIRLIKLIFTKDISE